MPAAVESNHGPKRRRDDRHDGNEHPLGPHAGLDHGFEKVVALLDFCAVQGACLDQVLREFLRQRSEVNALEDVVYRFGADARFKDSCVLHRVAMVAHLVKDAPFDERLYFAFGIQKRIAEFLGILFSRERLALCFKFRVQTLEKLRFLLLIHAGDDVAGKVDDFLQIAYREVEHHPNTRGNAAQKPDMRHRTRQFNVSHAFTTHNGARDFYSAFFANDILIADAAILAAVALVVFLGAEYFFIKEAAALTALGAIVNRFRLGHLAAGPLADPLGRSELERDGIKVRFYLFLWHMIIGFPARRQARARGAH